MQSLRPTHGIPPDKVSTDTGDFVSGVHVLLYSIHNIYIHVYIVWHLYAVVYMCVCVCVCVCMCVYVCVYVCVCECMHLLFS